MENQIKEGPPIQISWSAPEFAHYEKNRGWFLGLFLITAILLAIAVLMKNFLFAFLIIVSVFLIYTQAKKRPRLIEFIISEKGVTIDEKLYPYNELHSFWIFEEPEAQILSLISKKIIHPRLPIPLGDKTSEEIKEVLSIFIPLKKQEEAFSETLARKLKF